MRPDPRHNQPPNQSQESRLHALLAEEQAVLTSVLENLAAEAEALKHRDAEGVLAASQSKSEAIHRAGNLERERRLLCTANPALVTGRALQSLTELRRLARECQGRNEANGLLIRGQRRRLEASLNILRGGQPAADVYGRDGETRRPTYSRELASY